MGETVPWQWAVFTWGPKSQTETIMCIQTEILRMDRKDCNHGGPATIFVHHVSSLKPQRCDFLEQISAGGKQDHWKLKSEGQVWGLKVYFLVRSVAEVVPKSHRLSRRTSRDKRAGKAGRFADGQGWVQRQQGIERWNDRSWQPKKLWSLRSQNLTDVLPVKQLKSKVACGELEVKILK